MVRSYETAIEMLQSYANTCTCEYNDVAIASAEGLNSIIYFLESKIREHKPVAPLYLDRINIDTGASMRVPVCSNCHVRILTDKYCPNCGKEVKWDV